MALLFTAHAVERFRERFAPELDAPDARDRLEAVARAAVRVGTSPAGDGYWRDPATPAVMLVVREDPDGTRVVTTAVDPPDGPGRRRDGRPPGPPRRPAHGQKTARSRRR